MNNPITRIISFFVVLILVIALPWWLGSAIIIILIGYLPFYIESLFFGFMFDLLYSSNLHFPYVGLTSAALLLLIIMLVKSQIRR